MKLSNQRNREQVRRRWTEKNRRAQRSLLEFLILLEQFHRVVMNRVRHLMAERSGELLVVLDEIQQRIGDVNVAARRRKCIRLLLVDEIELEWMVVRGACSMPKARSKRRAQ